MEAEKIKNTFNVDFCKHNNCCSCIRSTLNVFFQKMTHKVGLCADKDMYERSLRYQYNAWSESARLARIEKGMLFHSSGHYLFIKS